MMTIKRLKFILFVFFILCSLISCASLPSGSAAEESYLSVINNTGTLLVLFRLNLDEKDKIAEVPANGREFPLPVGETHTPVLLKAITGESYREAAGNPEKLRGSFVVYISPTLHLTKKRDEALVIDEIKDSSAEGKLYVKNETEYLVVLARDSFEGDTIASLSPAEDDFLKLETGDYHIYPTLWVDQKQGDEIVGHTPRTVNELRKSIMITETIQEYVIRKDMPFEHMNSYIRVINLSDNSYELRRKGSGIQLETFDGFSLISRQNYADFYLEEGTAVYEIVGAEGGGTVFETESREYVNGEIAVFIVTNQGGEYTQTHPYDDWPRYAAEPEVETIDADTTRIRFDHTAANAERWLKIGTTNDEAHVLNREHYPLGKWFKLPRGKNIVILRVNKAIETADFVINYFEMTEDSPGERVVTPIREIKIPVGTTAAERPARAEAERRERAQRVFYAGEEMVFVSGGTFQMGSTVDYGDERPVRSVTVSSFYMSKYEVTQKEYESVMGGNPSSFASGSDAPNRPVERVSWYDALAYCNRLSASKGLTAVYYTDSGLSAKFSPSGSVPQSGSVYVNWSANGYRLPTEAEWEYAARGGSRNRGYTYSGSNTVGDVGWYNDNSGDETHPVGGKEPNELGLYDMSGNVWEWCWDWYYGSYPSGSQTDPRGPAGGSYRVRRGGSWDIHSSVLRSAYRGYYLPGFFRDSDIGFRVVRTR